MIAFGLMVLFPLAALLAIGVLSDCAFRATKAVKALRRQGARLQPACAARITVTSWRVVEDAAAPHRLGRVVTRRPRPASPLPYAAAA